MYFYVSVLYVTCGVRMVAVGAWRPGIIGCGERLDVGTAPGYLEKQQAPLTSEPSP